MPTYLGTSKHTLDDKSRLIVPKRFLEEVAPKDAQFTLTAGYERCLLLLDRQGWAEITADVSRNILCSRGERAMRRVFLGHAEVVSPDRSSRILIPEPLRQYAGMLESPEVVLVGTGKAVEIWSPARWLSVLSEAGSNDEFFDNNPVGGEAAPGS